MTNTNPDNLYFFSNIKNSHSIGLISELDGYALETKRQVYCLSAPMMDERYSYPYEGAFSVLIPGFPIIFVNMNGDEERFQDYVDDYLDDLSHIADRFNFSETLGRRRKWGKYYRAYQQAVSLPEILADGELKDKSDRKRLDIMVALILGCYNDAAQIDLEHDSNILEAIKSKVLLFDCNQTKFLYREPPEDEKVIFIQGLAGTGKTELLLHKLKNLYLKHEDAMFGIICHNKVLASVMKSRIPDFFNKMNVNRQIDWERNHG